MVSVKITVIENIKNITKFKYIIQPNDSTETHDVCRCNAPNTERNMYNVQTE